jgi:lipopolysaccharide transport system permease protein
MDSAQSVLASLQIVKKVYFPREILPLAGVISNFIHFLLGFIVFFLFLAVIYVKSLFGPGPAVLPLQPTIVLLPVLLLISLMLSTGLGLIISALNTFYEDVKYIAGIVLYLMFFLCPIMYFIEGITNSDYNLNSGGLVYKIYMTNPIAVLCVGYRKLLLAPIKVPVPGKAGLAEPLPIPWDYLAYSFILSFLLMIGGYALFNKLKWKFVERP